MFSITCCIHVQVPSMSNLPWLLIQVTRWLLSVTHVFTMIFTFCVEMQKSPSLRFVQIRPTSHSSSLLWAQPMGRPTDAMSPLQPTIMSDQCLVTALNFQSQECNVWYEHLYLVPELSKVFRWGSSNPSVCFLCGSVVCILPHSFCL
jgi:hypothetical protein